MEERLRAGEPEQAVAQAVEAMSELIAGHFPRGADDVDHDELPNQPHLL